MIIIDKIGKLESRVVSIPKHHWSHMSIKDDTEVSICYIPKNSTLELEMSELIISPIPFISWEHVWRINGVFINKQGVVHKFLSAVKDESINILYEESGTLDNRGHHQVELIIDASSMCFIRPDIGDDYNHDERLRSLERRLTAIMIDDVAFLDNGEPRLRVRRMKALRSAAKKYYQCIKEHDQDKRNPSPAKDKASIKSAQLRLPNAIYDKFKANLPCKFQVLSDTKERVLRIYIFGPNEDMDTIRITHHDEVGGLAAITKQLMPYFDIVTSYTRIQAQGLMNETLMTLFSRKYSSTRDANFRKSIINQVLSGEELESLNLKLEFVDSDDYDHVDISLTSEDNFSEVEEIPTTYKTISTEHILKAVHRKFVEKNDSGVSLKESVSLRRKINYLKKMINEETDNPAEIFDVFLSFDFARQELAEIVRQELLKHGVYVKSGQSPDEGLVFRQVIQRRIKKSDGFLGIWTEKEDGFCSPWLLWELGVAQSYNIPYRLLISSDIRKWIWQRINPEMHHYEFKDITFHASASKAIDKLVKDIKQSKGSGTAPFLYIIE